MKYFYTILFSILFISFIGCGNSEIKIGKRSKLTYEYDGYESFNIVRKKIEIEVYPEKVFNEYSNYESIELNIKNIGKEVFGMKGDDLFLMQGSKILNTLGNDDVEIEPGDVGEVRIEYSDSRGKPDRIDFVKRKDDELQVMFALLLK